MGQQHGKDVNSEDIINQQNRIENLSVLEEASLTEEQIEEKELHKKVQHKESEEVDNKLCEKTPESQRKDKDGGTSSADEGKDAKPPSKVRRLFRRHSSMKICPEDLPQEEGSRCRSAESSPKINRASPVPVDGNKNIFFSGILSPVPMTDPSPREGFITNTQLYNSMNDGQLSPYLYDPTYLLIVDTRGLDEYKEKHIITAYHVSELGDSSRVDSLDSYTLVVFYDHMGLSHTLPDSMLKRMVTDVKRNGIFPFILEGGFKSFHATHPYMCTNEIHYTGADRFRIIVSYPSIILEDTLFLGRGDHAANVNVIENLNVTHVLNITREHKNAFPDKLEYLNIKLDDESSSNLLKEFAKCVKFMTDAINSGGRLLVHCNLGVSRSSTLVVAYLMYTKRWTLRNAYTFLKERRPVIRPNNGFFLQLSKFEEMLFGRKLTNPEEI